MIAEDRHHTAHPVPVAAHGREWGCGYQYAQRRLCIVICVQFQLVRRAAHPQVTADALHSHRAKSQFVENAMRRNSCTCNHHTSDVDETKTVTASPTPCHRNRISTHSTLIFRHSLWCRCLYLSILNSIRHKSLSLPIEKTIPMLSVFEFLSSENVDMRRKSQNNEITTHAHVCTIIVHAYEIERNHHRPGKQTEIIQIVDFPYMSRIPICWFTGLLSLAFNTVVVVRTHYSSCLCTF